jgi:Rhamnan synthesis protein F
MLFLLPRLKRIVAAFTFYLRSIPLRVSLWFSYYVTRSARQAHVIKSIFDSEENSEFDVAIVALYPRKAILKSVLRLIDVLILENVHVICVVNASVVSPEWINALLERKLTIISRPNRGRDFGAYKTGYLYANKSGFLSNAQRLIFANDSVFYGPKSQEFVAQLLQERAPWQAMFVNYQYHTHGQSFFQVFDAHTFKTRSFRNFWKNYYPSELRHLAINKGEVGISTALLGIGISPTPYVTDNKILESSNFTDFEYDEKFALWSNLGIEFLNPQIATRENTIHQLRRAFLELNTTHHAGLLASRVLGAPLKLDIFQTGLTTINGIETTLIALGIEEIELQGVLSAMTLKGTHASKKGFQKLWNSYGYV